MSSRYFMTLNEALLAKEAALYGVTIKDSKFKGAGRGLFCAKGLFWMSLNAILPWKLHDSFVLMLNSFFNGSWTRSSQRYYHSLLWCSDGSSCRWEWFNVSKGAGSRLPPVLEQDLPPWAPAYCHKRSKCECTFYLELAWAVLKSIMCTPVQGILCITLVLSGSKGVLVWIAEQLCHICQQHTRLLWTRFKKCITLPFSPFFFAKHPLSALWR